MTWERLSALPEKQEAALAEFQEAGGCEIQAVREDVGGGRGGRVIGWALLEGRLPLEQAGRAGLPFLQK